MRRSDQPGEAEQSSTLILVVDDEELLRTFLRTVLEQDGFEVCEASNGMQAFEQCVARRPDLIMMDVRMPGMDGFAACQELRRSVEGSRVPILIMTGLEDSESIARAYECGATDFVAKPINSTILGHRVRYMLRGSTTMNALRRSEARLGLAQRIAKMGNWEWLPAIDRFTASSELCRLIGIREQDFGGTKQAFLQMIHEGDRPRVDRALLSVLMERMPCNLDHRVILLNGHELSVNLQAEALVDDQLKMLTVVGTVQDISERKRAEREIHRLAYYDNLTGLANRVRFKDCVAQALAYAGYYRTTLALLFLDLDRFKAINDTLGHNVGDVLLKQVADRLRDSVRHSDSVGWSVEHGEATELARLGGDEFTVLLANIPDAQIVATIAQRILNALSQSFMIEGHECSISASIGIALFPTDGDSVDLLLKSADIAMYQAKELGRNNFQFCSAALNAVAMERRNLERDLRAALERHELIVYYQPQVDLQSQQIVGAEALVRWRHPQRGMLQPAAFLPMAIETGMIRQVEEAVLVIAGRQNKAWQDAGYTPIRISASVSNAFLHGSSFIKTIQQVLQETGLASEYLELEFKESIAAQQMETILPMLRTLHVMGVRLAIGDFGTRYSILNDLKQFPLRRIKVDQSFIHDVTRSTMSASIIHAIVSLAHSMNFSVLAKGVETNEQVALLRQQGCDEVQGCLLGPPMTGEELEKRLVRAGSGELRSHAA